MKAVELLDGPLSNGYPQACKVINSGGRSGQ